MARSYLTVVLRERPLPWAEIVAEAMQFGHAEKTLRTVRSEVAEKERIDGRWHWRLKEGMGNG